MGPTLSFPISPHSTRPHGIIEAAQTDEADGGKAAVHEFAPRVDALRAALRRYDERGLRAVLDDAFARHSTEEVLQGLVFPFLRGLGDAWESGEISVAQEHWASTVVRNRLVALDALPDTVADLKVVLACTPHERHDIGLIGLDMALRARGCVVHFLGADSPLDAVARVCREVSADLLVLAGTERHMFAAQVEQAAETLRSLAPTRIALGGPAARAQVAELVGASLLPLDIAAAADEIAFGRSLLAAEPEAV